jgi:hypothetical protein
MRLSKIVLGALILPVLAVGCKPPPPPVAKAPPAPPQPVQLEQVKAAKEKISFEIEVPHALQLYKALSPDGRGPKTHEEFMTNVIEANRIKLPLLPPEHRYVYNPETEELMVERPKAAQLPVQP